METLSKRRTKAFLKSMADKAQAERIEMPHTDIDIMADRIVKEFIRVTQKVKTDQRVVVARLVTNQLNLVVEYYDAKG